MKHALHSASWAVLSSLLAAHVASAQPVAATGNPKDTADASLDEVIVTGTRVTGIRAVDSPAPIQVVDNAALERTGRVELAQTLGATVPSFTTQPFGGDASNLKLSARLRGLSANHTLILVNGKRRHGTSNLTVSLTGGFAGAASADLTFLPVASIGRVEVLQDGAAAQYGTDAVAGVINIILKDKDRGGSISATAGQYYEGDGDTFAFSANAGFAPVAGSHVNVTFERRVHDYSDRGEADQRFFTAANLANPLLSQIPGYPHANLIFGDARYELTIGAVDASFELGNGVELYGFGTYGRREAKSRQNFRFPSVASSLWPLGFTPIIAINEDDYAFTGGIRGEGLAGWNWDLSTTYGRDDASVGNLNSANTSLIADTGTSPRNFHVGDFIASQWSTTLDLSRAFDLGLAEPVNVALGAEYRRETFEIGAGDAAARYKTGSQAYPGFGLTDAAKHSRNNKAAYIDVAFSPVAGLKLDLAGRYEDFSDFGDTAVGKLTARYDFSPAFALRGTVSTGFRAPTLAESYYSATTVTPTTAGVRLPPNNAAAALLGISPLKAEDSTNFSVGFVAHPAPKLAATLDLYQIDIDDRIVSTGTIFGLQNNVVRSAAVTAAIRANGNVLDPTVSSTSISTFVNGADTRTRGAELVVTYASDFGDLGAVDWTLGANWNETDVRKVAAPSAQIAASGQRYLDRTALSYLETVSPKYKASLGAVYRKGRVTVDLKETLYGPSSIYSDGGNTGNYVKNKQGAELITDLDIGVRVAEGFQLSVGASNLFDVQPDEVNPVTYAASLPPGPGNGVAKGLTFAPFGINGGYYYVRASYAF